MTALHLPPLARRAATMMPAAIDDSIVTTPGYSYVCRRCDVYGYLAPGEEKRCWACEAGDRLDRR